MTASPVGSLDQAFLHIHGVVHGFHIHGRGWDGFGFDVRHCGNGLELGNGIRFGLWHEGGWFELWCSMVRLRFGMIWDWFGLWCRMVRLRFGMVGSCSVGWLHVGFGRRVGDNWCGCIMRRFWFHVGGWLRPVHRLWFQVGGWLRTVHRLWPVHGRTMLVYPRAKIFFGQNMKIHVYLGPVAIRMCWFFCCFTIEKNFQSWGV